MPMYHRGPHHASRRLVCVVVTLLLVLGSIAGCGGEADPTATAAAPALAATSTSTPTTPATPTAPTAAATPTDDVSASYGDDYDAPDPTATAQPPAVSTATVEPEPTATEEQAAEPAEVEILIQGFAFEPAEITVPIGTTVTWLNMDSVDHSATDDEDHFDTGLFPQGESRSHTFDTPGTYSYYCLLHPSMTATIVVE